jgi:Protein of unknown function (DUF2950)
MAAARIIKSRTHRRGFALAAVCCLVALTAGCKGGSSAPSIPATPQTFASQDAAGSALYNATKANDTNALLTIFGSNSKALVLSGDPTEDKNGQDKFVASYDRMHRWDKLRNGSYILTIGASNYPLPIPLVKNASGQWYFDGEAGKQEILARRVGANELRVMDVLSSMADAQDDYYSQLHDGATVQQYAQKFVSDPGKHNGLYWKAADGEEESPLGPLAASAAADGYTKGPGEPFHGYYYKILTKQGDEANGGAMDYVVNGAMTGGYAIIAWPADYGNSGVMTFVMTSDGALYQKDFGADTANAVKSIDALDLDAQWTLLQ